MSFDNAYFSIGRIDRLSYQDTVIHRLDPRAKVLATMAFIVTVVSHAKYEVSALAPLFLYPIVLASLGDIPVLFLLRKVLLVAPFAVFVGIFNPLFDRDIVMVAGMTISAGWISLLSLLIKFVLTVSAALLLISTTSFPGVCHAFRRLGMPPLFISQLLFLYRYLFVLMEEAMRIVRARQLRLFRPAGIDMHTAARIFGTLFIRTIERAERVYGAMLARGFRGDIPTLKRFGLRGADLLFVSATVAALLFFRLVPVTVMIGQLVRGAAE